MIIRVDINSKVTDVREVDSLESLPQAVRDKFPDYQNYTGAVPDSPHRKLVNGEIVIDTDAEALDNETAITAEATRLIEERYSPLKQRKLMSIAIALQDKQLRSIILSSGEEEMLQVTRDANEWITAIRVIENIAIANSILLANIDWTIV